MSPITITLELALAALLAACLFYCWRLDRKLSALRAGQDGIRAAARELMDSVAAAESAVKAMRQTAHEAGRDLQGRIDTARALADRLGMGLGKVRSAADLGRGALMVQKGASPPRLLPALMVTLGVLLSLKAVAFAEGASTPAPAAAPKTTKTGAATPVANTASCPAPSFADSAGLSPSEVQVLQSLGARRELLDQRASDIDTRQELLAAAERRVEDRLAELKRLEARVQELMGTVDEEQTKRVTMLVDVYQRMRAKDAAAVFDALDEEVLVDVASRMRQANLAEIMGKMDPARARRLTILLSQVRGADAAALTRAATPPAPRPATATPAASRPPAPAAARPKAG